MSKPQTSDRTLEPTTLPTAEAPRPRLELATPQRRQALMPRYETLAAASPEKTLRAYAHDILRQLGTLEHAEATT